MLGKINVTSDFGLNEVNLNQRVGEERIQQQSNYGEMFQSKRQKTCSTRLPPGWLDCPAVGQEIGCIIPSKVPLGEAFNDAIAPDKRYSFRQVIHLQQKVLSRNLGLVIDLTNTNRYYSLNELKKQGIKHVKIACRGRDSVPDNESVNHFVYEVSQFLARQKHAAAKKHILVHCTHGHNRTGYMIVHYLMRSTFPVSVSVTQAIKLFADARPPGIYKPDYIDALYSFYHEKKPEMLVCPSTPEWKKFDLDDDDGSSAAVLPLVNNEPHVVVLTNDDVLGDGIPLEQQEALRQFCYQALKLLPGGGWKGYSLFPGSHPVSLNSENVKLLRQSYYYVTWKADGTRYMMLILMDGCYLIDRHFNFRRVQMRFPYRNTKKTTHHFTLLDGEMVIDTVPDSGKKERRYLIYDMMAMNSISIIDRPFNERWKMIEKEVIEPRNYERQRQSRNPYYYRYELEPFRVKRKDFWVLSTAEQVLNLKLWHASDGLIFQGWDDPYVPRTDEGLLKWKSAEMNSVDLLLEVVDDNRQQLYLHERGRKKLMEGNSVIFEDGSDCQLHSGKIIECSWKAEEKVWKFIRDRVDKGSPNEFNTYKKVMRSIKDNITKQILLQEIEETIELPMYKERIQRETRS